MKQSAIDAKMSACKAIMERGTTRPEEAAAAKAFYDKLAALRADATPSFTWAPRFMGTKYQDTKHLGQAELNRRIRADIKLARQLGRVTAAPGTVAFADPIGDAPAQIRIGVKSHHFGSVTITVSNIPDDWYTERNDGVGGAPVMRPDDRLLRLGCALRALVNEYNYDDSDAQIDHFNTRFYLHVYDEKGNSIDYERSPW